MFKIQILMEKDNDRQIIIDNIKSKFSLSRRRYVSISSEIFEATEINSMRNVMLIKARGNYPRLSKEAELFLKYISKIISSDISIPEIYSYGVTRDGEIFICCETAFGTPLQALRFSEDNLYALVRGVLETVSKLHKLNLIFGSLTQDAFVWWNSRVIFIGLIPVVSEMKRSINPADEQIYSRYLAPELKESRVTIKSDIFSLGLIIWEIASSRRIEIPRNADGLKSFLYKELSNKKSSDAHFWISSATEKALSWEEKQRPSSVEAMLSLIKKPKLRKIKGQSFYEKILNFHLEDNDFFDFMLKMVFALGIIVGSYYVILNFKKQHSENIESVDLVSGVKGQAGEEVSLFRRGDAHEEIGSLPEYVKGNDVSLFKVGSADDDLLNSLKNKSNEGQVIEKSTEMQTESELSNITKKVVLNSIPTSRRLLFERCLKQNIVVLPFQKNIKSGFLCGEPIVRKVLLCNESIVYKKFIGSKEIMSF